MRICFLSSMHPSTDKRVFDKEARALADANHDVVHLAPVGDVEVIGSRMQDGIEIVSYPPALGIKGRLLGLVRLYQMAKKIDAQVYHCNEVDSWMVGVVLKILRGRICIFDVHEHYPEEFAEKRIPNWARPIVRFLIASLMRFLSIFTQHIVLAKSSLLKNFTHMPKGTVHLVQNFVPLAFLPELDPNRSNDGPLKIIHLGLFNRYRGWPQLLEALSIARSQDAKLLVLGNINDGSEAEFQNMIEKLHLSDRVVYQAWVPFDEAMQKVKASDVGVVCFQPGFFNHIHALPHKMFDYMGAELAVLAPDIAIEVSDIIRTTNCGFLIDSSDPKSIANAIDQLSENREILRELGRNGRAAVQRRFNWEAEAQTLVNLYQELEAE
jgi:glycosyltransferase involved in cell wall biosynthesis